MKVIIFDAYGTLISTGTGSIDAAKKILSLQTKKINPEKFYGEWKKIHRMNLDSSNIGSFLNEASIFALDLKHLYFKYGIERNSELDVQIMLDTLGRRQCFDETLTVIEKLKKKYRVVIGSTTDSKPLYLDLERNGLSVDAVYTSELIEKYKPDPDFYKFILKKENCGGESAIFVGDSYIDDVYGPSLVGIKSILIDRKKNFQQVPGAAAPWKITHSLHNIIDIIDEMKAIGD